MKKCPFCAEEIQDAAIVCKHCGRDVGGAGVGRVAVAAPPRKPRSLFTVLAILIGVCVLGGLGVVAVIVSIIGSGSSGRSSSSSSPGSRESALTIAAAELFEEYQRNEVAADGKYKGAVLVVSGLVKDIGNDITNVPYVVLGENVDNPIGTQAMFAPSERGSVAQLSKGQRVTVRCRGGGKMMNVILRDCVLR